MKGKNMLKEFEGKRILILGDIMLDRYLYGDVDRISPEAPVPVMDLRQIDNRLGGAANVAINLKALGVTPVLCGMIGDDGEGKMLMHEMKVAGLMTEGVLVSKDRRTTLKTRVIAHGQHLLRVDSEDRFPSTPDEKARLKQFLGQLLESSEIDAFIFQDYNKGLLDGELIEWAVEQCLEKDIPTLVDPKKEHLRSYRGITLFKPNLKEVTDLLGKNVTAEVGSLREAAIALREILDQDITFITLGKDGIFYEKDGEGSIEPTIPRNIVDVCGAGDTVLSIAAAGLAAGMDLHVIASLANLAGGQVCEKVGVVSVEKEKLLEDYSKNKG